MQSLSRWTSCCLTLRTCPPVLTAHCCAGRYVPSARLAFEYPDDYPAPTADCAADSNILLHADWSFAGEPATCGADDADRSMWATQSAAGTKLEEGTCGWQSPHPHEPPSQARGTVA